MRQHVGFVALNMVPTFCVAEKSDLTLNQTESQTDGRMDGQMLNSAMVLFHFVGGDNEGEIHERLILSQNHSISASKDG